MDRWNVVQHELIPELEAHWGAMTPKLERVIHILEWVRIEEFTAVSWCGVGRPPFERAWLANAFVAKAVLGMTTTAGLIERLMIDRALRRICGFPLHKALPSEATFSRAFDEFAGGRLGQRVHEALIKEHLGDQLIGHLNRDGTAIEARERPARNGKAAEKGATTAQPTLLATEESPAAPTSTLAPPAPARKRGRRGGAKRVRRRRPPRSSASAGKPWRKCSRRFPPRVIAARSAMPKATRTVGPATSCISTPPTVVSPISALLSSASMHDSLAAISLSLISAERVTNLYDLMDAAYCSTELRAHSKSLGHVPLIDHNPRRGEKIEFSPAEAIRYHERSAAERSNARLKDEFGGRNIRVRGHTKVMAHLMFGLLALSADQLMRLRR
jgi:hypothetical protein